MDYLRLFKHTIGAHLGATATGRESIQNIMSDTMIRITYNINQSLGTLVHRVKTLGKYSLSPQTQGRLAWLYCSFLISGKRDGSLLGWRVSSDPISVTSIAFMKPLLEDLPRESGPQYVFSPKTAKTQHQIYSRIFFCRTANYQAIKMYQSFV